MMMGGPEMVLGMRYCTYIWSMVISPGVEAPVAGVSGKLVVVVWALTKNTPSSSSSKAPPSDSAAAAAVMPAKRPAASRAAPAVLRLGLRLMVDILPKFAIETCAREQRSSAAE